MSQTLTATYGALVRAHHDTLLRAARLLTGDWRRAESLLRETLAWTLNAWQVLGNEGGAPLRVRQQLVASYLERAQARGPGSGWSRSVDRLAGTADRAPTAAVRANGAGPAEPGRPDGRRTAGPDGRPVRVAGLLDALSSLQPRDRAVVVSRHYLGLSAAEIGEALGLASADVSATAERALDALQWV